MQMEKLLLYYKSRGYTEFNEPRTMIYYTVGLFKRWFIFQCKVELSYWSAVM